MELSGMGKILIIAGIVLVVFGLAASSKLGPLGRLPGDIVVQRPHFTFYAPIATSILLSVGLTILLWLFRR